MRFSCPQEELKRAIGIAKRAVGKAQQTILDCILFEADDDVVTLKATDRNLSICTSIDARVEHPGSVAVPANLLADYVNLLPAAEVTMDEASETQVEISALSAKGSIQKMDPKEFPEFPDMRLEGGEEGVLTLPTATLASMVGQTRFAVATSNDRPIFTGILFDIKKDKLLLVALDGFRMAIREEAIESAEEQQCVVPQRTLSALTGSFDDEDEQVSIRVDGGRVLFETPRTRFISQLLEGNYMPYEKLFPASFATYMQVDREPFQDGLRRADKMARDGESSIVTFHIKDDMLELTGRSQETSSQEPIPVITRGDELEISLNARFVLDVLAVLTDQEVTMNFNTPISACCIERTGPGGYRYLILPVQRRS